MAFASPDAGRRGDWRNHPPIFQNQIAATKAHLLGVDYREQNQNAGAPIMQLLDGAGDRPARTSR